MSHEDRKSPFTFPKNFEKTFSPENVCFQHHKRRKNESKYEFPQNFAKTQGKECPRNPGTILDIHKNAYDIRPIWIEGVEVRTRKLFAINKTGYCNWSMGHSLPSGFRIGGTYQQQLSDDILITPCYGFDINPSNLSTNFGFVYYPHPKVGVEVSLQADPLNKNRSVERLKGNFVVNFNGPRNSLSCSLHETGRLIVSDLYKISPKLSIGTELMLHWRGKGDRCQLALAGRYNIDRKSVIAATCSLKALDVTYWRQLSPTLQAGTSLVFNSTNNFKNLEVFYQWETENASIRSLIDTNLTAGFTYTKLFENLSSSFCLSLYWCMLSNKFSCGFKFDLDDTFLGNFYQLMQNNKKNLSSLLREKELL